MNALIRGTFILTLATMISKVLGFIYVVPFTALVGIQGYILFEYAYQPYSIILSLATMGVPMAVSKFVSKYNELGDYQTGRRLFRSGLTLMTITGVITFLILYFTAPEIASYIIDENDRTGNKIEDVVYVIRMVSFALIIVPSMSLIRGYFQGFQSMGPTAMSQVVEQIVRIIFILLSGYIIVKIHDSGITKAVGYATFGAFVGGIAGLFILIGYYMKRRKWFNKLAAESEFNSNISLWDMYKEIIAYAIPFVLVGLALPIYQLVDVFMMNKALIHIGYQQVDAENVNSIVALVKKVIFIPVSLATAFGLSLVPAITKYYTAKDMKTMYHQITKTLQIVFFLTMPATVGLTVLGRESFVSLFGVTQGDFGGYIMSWSAPTAMFFSLYILTAAILQGLDKQKKAVLSLLVGFLFKVAFNYLAIVKFQAVGSIWTTNIGFAISIFLNTWWIIKEVKYPLRSVKKEVTTITVLCMFMAVIVLLSNLILGRFLLDGIQGEFLKEVIKLVIGIGLGGLFYLIASYKVGLAEDVLGNRINKFKRKNRA
jgi:O-antigen/teichoic acid export membrane protein